MNSIFLNCLASKLALCNKKKIYIVLLKVEKKKY